mmetsp:Transcript_12481/g.50175  ORF Transcript_12481/g.50175 Transcript_12481/m.50175 type:complete len:183 (+) Transcript_12481:3-551(+)
MAACTEHAGDAAAGDEKPTWTVRVVASEVGGAVRTVPPFRASDGETFSRRPREENWMPKKKALASPAATAAELKALRRRFDAALRYGLRATAECEALRGELRKLQELASSSKKKGSATEKHDHGASPPDDDDEDARAFEEAFLDTTRQRGVGLVQVVVVFVCAFLAGRVSPRLCGDLADLVF